MGLNSKRKSTQFPTNLKRFNDSNNFNQKMKQVKGIYNKKLSSHMYKSQSNFSKDPELQKITALAKQEVAPLDVNMFKISSSRYV